MFYLWQILKEIICKPFPSAVPKVIVLSVTVLKPCCFMFHTSVPDQIDESLIIST